MASISFDRAADFYDATRGYAPGWSGHIRDAIVRHVGATAATRFLELGVGTGRIALPFIRAGYHYTGVDISPAMMERLRAQLADDPHAPTYRYDLREADVTQLPFPAASFDVVLAVHVLHLINAWQQALHEARRVLRPGGWLLIGYDHMPNDPDAAQQVCTPQQVRKKWHEITSVLRPWDEAGRVNVRDENERITRVLRSLGAEIQTVELSEIRRPPISARTMAERLKNRSYSSDWNTPDDIHARAVQQLEAWLATQDTDIDTPVSARGIFKAVVAHWKEE